MTDEKRQSSDEARNADEFRLKELTQMTQQEVEEPIREFIATRLLYSNKVFNYPDEASLLREGIIDSLGVVELVEFLQKHFQLKIEQQEVRPDNFDSVVRLAAYVRRKCGVAA
jgi:acyl carrier protein